MRLALVTLFVALTACGSNEAKLEAAVESLKAQLSARQRLLSEAEDLARLGQELDAWRAVSGQDELPLVPQPRVPLTPYKLAPLAVPQLPPASSLESARASELRSEAAALLEAIREADAALSQQELRKKDLAHRLDVALEIDRQKRQVREVREQLTEPFPFALPFVDAGIVTPPPQGKMRRLDQ